MTVTPANVIITGAGRGIGHAILVHLLGLPNPPNILAFSRNIEPLKPLVDVHKNLEAVSIDFSAPSAKLRSQITESIDRMISKFGGIDSVILNHSSLDPIARIQDADLEQWETTYQVNLFSNVELIKAVLPELRRAKGRVVMVSSGAAELFFTGWSAYGSTKAALNHLASSLAHEESEITTVAIAPGIVDTDMQQALRETHGKVMPSQEHSIFVTMKENGTIIKPENVGAVLGNLCLNATTELSGKFLNWDDEKLVAYR